MPGSFASKRRAEDDSDAYDVIVVGAGAAGAVLAARLAEGGARVLVLEAGSDPLDPVAAPGEGRSLRYDYLVPAFHAFASENPRLRRDVWVRHYSDTERQKRDWRYDAERDGVLYPRAQGLGGCSAHHAMIIVKPNDRDWNHIAETIGDPSWSAPAMQRYWERIERCRYRWFPWRWLAWLTGLNPTGHGWRGWLTTEWGVPLRVLRDRRLMRQILRSMGAAADASPDLVRDWQETTLDPNARRVWNAHASGARLPPMSTRRHVRSGPRERLRAAEMRCRNQLTIRLHAEVRAVIIEDKRATGVIYRHEGREKRASGREVVLAAGAFATPHLMLLSGIGEPEHLETHDIAPVHTLPGVGRNLQDRYEVGVVNKMKRPWDALRDVRYSCDDNNFRLWKYLRIGNYKSNGIVFATEIRSREALPQPDIYCFAVLADFRGYHEGYAQRLLQADYLTWGVLKAYTANRAGTVRLRSADPETPPLVEFRYFDEGSAGSDEDLDAVVAGIRFVRKIADAMGAEVAVEEEPGRHLLSDAALRDYVRDNAWGHHACGTCAMAPETDGGVVDAQFRVHGLKGLRIVDASIFPRIPGYFLVSAVYMIAEKAADTILRDMA